MDCEEIKEMMLAGLEDPCGMDDLDDFECALARLDSNNAEDLRDYSLKVYDELNPELAAVIRDFDERCVQNGPQPDFWSEYYDAMIPHCEPCLPDVCTQIGDKAVAEIFSDFDVDFCHEVVDLTPEELKQYFLNIDLFNTLDQKCFQEGHSPDVFPKMVEEIQRVCKEEGNGNQTAVWVAIVIVILMIGIGAWFYVRSRKPDTTGSALKDLPM